MGQENEGKPCGLWLSVNDDWLTWCRSEQFQLHSLAHATEVILAAGANILRLHSPDELDEFSKRFAHGGLDYEINHCVRWSEVANLWQGIIIEPYQWSRRLTPHTSWYYGWDIASGCIWDAETVAELRPINIPAECSTEGV
jgi:hypothetical protein